MFAALAGTSGEVRRPVHSRNHTSCAEGGFGNKAMIDSRGKRHYPSVGRGWPRKCGSAGVGRLPAVATETQWEVPDERAWGGG